MKFFSGLFGQKKDGTVKDLAVTDELAEAPSETSAEKHTSISVDTMEENVFDKLEGVKFKLSKYSQTMNLSKELQFLMEQQSTAKSDYFRILSILKNIVEAEEKKLHSHKLILSMSGDIKLISAYVFDKKFSGFENFYEDFPYLITEFRILETLYNDIPDAYEDETLKALHQNYKLLSPSFEKACEESKRLKIEEDALSEEIIKYSDTVNKLKQKYRLSIDWDGKKTMMISLGQKLSEKRSALLSREMELEEELTILYDGYPSMHEEFIRYCDYFLNILQLKIDAFDQSEIYNNVFNEIHFSLSNIVKNNM